MKKQISRLDEKHNPKIIACVMALFALLYSAFGVLMFLAFFLDNDPELLMVGVFALAAPVFYLIFGYIGSWIVFKAYNIVAEKYGGIRLELSNVTDEKK